MVSFDDFKKMDLRVAEIIDIKDHPDADRLYVMQIRVGEEEKQIVGGIREFYPKEELLNRKIVIINNLEPVNIRGEESNGMLLAAKDGKIPVVLIPDRDVPSGALIG